MLITFSSSNLASGEYFAAERRLRITFKNRSVYDYDDVPAQVVEELRGAISQGSYFAEHIKNAYRGARVQ